MKQLLFGLAALVAAMGHAKAVTIYHDQFGRTGGLDTTKPAPIDSPNQPWVADSSITTDGRSLIVPGFAEAYLPLSISTPGTYTLTVTLRSTAANDSDDFLALGFTSAMGTTGTYYNVASPPIWVAYQANGSVFGISDGENGSLNHPVFGRNIAEPGSPDTITISVNTVTGAFSISDSDALFDSSASGTMTEAGDITGIGIGANGDDSGAFRNLIVTGPVPEPASLVLSGIGSLALLARRRRV